MALDVEGLYLRYGPAVLRRCRSILRDPSAAEDVAQEVFVSALRFEARLRDEAPGALLLRIATNLSLNRLRGERRRPEDADPDVALRIARASDDDGASAESRAVARNLLARLFRPDDPLAASTQTLAFMHLVDGMTLDEVAREARLSVSGRPQTVAHAARPAGRIAGGRVAMKNPNDESRWMLERLALGELDAATAADLRRRLTAAGVDVDEALARLAASNAELLAAHPPARVVPAIRNRAAQRGQVATARPRRAPWLAVPVALAGALALALWARPGLHGPAPARRRRPGADHVEGFARGRHAPAGLPARIERRSRAARRRPRR